MGSRYKGTAKELRALNAFVALQRAAESVEGSTQAEIVRAKLTQSQFGALEALLHLGPLCAAQLARKILRTKGNLTLVIENLEKGGLVSRARRDDDRRVLTVELTAKGRRLVGGMFPAHAAGIARAFGVLTAEEQEELRRLCRKLGKAQK
ncbi:MAG: MarR family winged helix-turn-helix transcriptional regulator [Elusimicrobia bacterium]|nr:MarR family winged helix-turn-helix transcriptional regulator [Elusimicrobiota bacterium]